MSQNTLSKAWDSGLKVDAGAPPAVVNAPAAAPAAEVKPDESAAVKKSSFKPALASKVPALKSGTGYVVHMDGTNMPFVLSMFTLAVLVCLIFLI